jgi:hypothetical protein
MQIFEEMQQYLRQLACQYTLVSFQQGSTHLASWREYGSHFQVALSIEELQ